MSFMKSYVDTISSIEYWTEKKEKMQQEIGKFKEALDKYGNKRVGKSYDDAYEEWGGPDPRMNGGMPRTR